MTNSPARAELAFLREVQCKLRFLEITFPSEQIASLRRAVISRMMMLAQATGFVLLLAVPGMAQEHKHHDETIYGATAKFYETWMRPDMPEMSCCNRADCDVAVDVRRFDGLWWARKRSGGPLVSIPPAKIEQRRDSPDGQSHLCAVNGNVLCFLPASGG